MRVCTKFPMLEVPPVPVSKVAIFWLPYSCLCWNWPIVSELDCTTTTNGQPYWLSPKIIVTEADGEFTIAKTGPCSVKLPIEPPFISNIENPVKLRVAVTEEEEIW